jgi:hypothetical protein
VSGAPFRDLFVELPRALFAVLQGIGESAVRNTPSPFQPRREPQLLMFLRNAGARAVIARRYGWISIDEPKFAPDDDAVDLVVRRACGHLSRVRLDGRIFEEYRPHAALDELDRRLFRHHERGRRCYCVARPGA